MNSEEILGYGRQLLRQEAQALDHCAELLSESFSSAVTILAGGQGKVILTGLGKSGHVARKISATFSSTGTPSCFLHPAEALHGDLGMIGAGDILVALAHGGETQEVLDVVSFAKRRDLFVIGFTSKLESSLARLCDVTLTTAVSQEACPLGLAPTSSTTVAMALGDALAVCLMRIKGFKQEDFADVHPGGDLGRRLAAVADFMHPIETLSPIKISDSFHSILTKVTQNNFGIGAVMDRDDNLVGVITDGDLRRGLLRYEGRVFDLRCKDLMSIHPKVTYPHALAIQAFHLMEKSNITSLFVVEADRPEKLLGVIRLHDLLAAKIV